MLDEKQIKEFLDSVDITIMSSINSLGYPISRALLEPRKIKWINIFYFSTNTSSNKIEEYKNNPKACLYFFNKNKFEWLSITWEMEIINDIETKKLIWKEWDELYYPKWINDEDYTVLKFTWKEYRFYSNFNTQDFILN